MLFCTRFGKKRLIIMWVPKKDCKLILVGELERLLLEMVKPFNSQKNVTDCNFSPYDIKIVRLKREIKKKRHVLRISTRVFIHVIYILKRCIYKKIVSESNVNA